MRYASGNSLSSKSRIGVGSELKNDTPSLTVGLLPRSLRGHDLPEKVYLTIDLLPRNAHRNLSPSILRSTSNRCVRRDRIRCAQAAGLHPRDVDTGRGKALR